MYVSHLYKNNLTQGFNTILLCLLFQNSFCDITSDLIMQVTRAAQYWHMLTFQFVNPMMSLGVTKQLDLEDLVSLPLDLMPSPCHDTFLRCWVAEEHKNQSKSLLFRVICKAYGWPYLRLGLLKVLLSFYCSFLLIIGPCFKA